MEFDHQFIEHLLSVDTESLMEELGEDIVMAGNTQFAAPPSRRSIIDTGTKWWENFRAETLCPVIHTKPALKAAISHKVGVPQVNHILTIAGFISPLGDGLSHVRAVVVAVILVRDTLQSVCPDSTYGVGDSVSPPILDG